MRYWLSVLVCVLSVAGACAQEAEEKILGGKVTTVSASSITVENLKTKKVETYTISAEAEILRDRKPVSATDIKVGELIRITAKGNSAVAIGLKALP